jgi:aryl-alcohol dehydrogenase-like predicted oxidoreductase
MKVMGQQSLVGEGPGKAPAEELIRYVLSLPVTAAEIGHTSVEILEQNVAAARSFTPMSHAEMASLRSRLSGSAAAWARFLGSHRDGGEA